MQPYLKIVPLYLFYLFILVLSRNSESALHRLFRTKPSFFGPISSVTTLVAVSKSDSFQENVGA